MTDELKPLSEVFDDLAHDYRRLARETLLSNYYEAQSKAYDHASRLAAEREVEERKRGLR